MRFNVAQQLRESTGSVRRVEIDELCPQLQDLRAGPVQGSAIFLRSGRGILVTASLTTTVQVACCRCLEEASLSLAIPFEEEFFPHIDVLTGARLPEPEEDDPLFIDEHHMLDLGDVVREYCLLAIPLRPLCRPDCAGLCPQCGRNRNLEPCSCRPPEDERWAMLASLRDLLANRERS